MAFMDIKNPKTRKSYLQIRDEVHNRFKYSSSYPSKSPGARPLPLARDYNGGRTGQRFTYGQKQTADEDFRKHYKIGEEENATTEGQG